MKNKDKIIIIVNCQVYENKQQFPKLETFGKEFKIKLDKKFLEDKELLKEVLSKMINKKSNDEYKYEYFDHIIQDDIIEELGTQKEFIKTKEEL